MCGRFSLFAAGEAIAERFSLPTVPAVAPRWNVAPAQMVAAVGTKADGSGRGFTLFRWGLVPHWSHDLSGPKPINAMAETVASKPMFRDAFRKRRCLIIADGFYEWRAAPGGKEPVHFRLKDGSVFGLAGIWDPWEGPDGAIVSCAILTTTPNALMAPVHNRMPVIVPPSAYDQWLDPTLSDPARLEPLLRPYPAVEMAAKPASRKMNDARFEGPQALVPDERPTRLARKPVRPARRTPPGRGPR